MADAAVTFALETIRDLLFEEGKFLLAVRDQVKELQRELQALQGFLKDAMARRHEHERLRACVSQAQRLASEAEDIIEEYAIKVASKRGGGGGRFKKVARRAAYIAPKVIAIHKAGNKISKIKSEIVNLKNSLDDYGINGIIEAQPSSATIDKQRRKRTTYAHQVDEYFVGMDNDVSKIVALVTEDNKLRHFISICGNGGLGKTTIARKVFNHIKKSSERSFECFAWVSVTQECQVKMLLQDIVFQIMGEKVEVLGEQALVRMLHSELENKKCFVVLDDIWNVDDWESLHDAFPTSERERCSKILLTTRITDVAEVAEPDSRHEPKLLDDKDGWDLLSKIALNLQENEGNTLPKPVKNVVAEMLHKCAGLPLAISALGGILKNTDLLTEWETVNSKFGAYLRREGGVVSTLALSYADLPSYLRPCFLYMGCFKEDEEIEITRLYQLWMAEGLISTRQKEPEETLMDVASNFLDELISRNMVQPLIRNELTDEKFCRLHDLMRELCLTKGREEEFMEVKSIPIRGKETGRVTIGDISRQTILVDSEDNCNISIAKLTDETCIRALIFNRRFICHVEGALKYISLRSLILDDCQFKDNKLPKEIKDMIHLRYLSLRNSLPYGKLPAYISDLQYMQILNVSDNDCLQLPNIFHKMKRLRCLYLPSFDRVESKSRKKLEFHGLDEIEVVEDLNSRYDDFTHLSKLIKLRRLKAKIWDYKDLHTILEQLSSLLEPTPRRSQNQISVKLYIDFRTEEEDSGSILEKREMLPDVMKPLLCCIVRDLTLYSRIGEFPRYERQFWPDLVSLQLGDTEFEKDPMPFLQELPNLRKLRMEHYAYVGKEMHCSSKAFLKLTSLLIISLPKIEKWKVDAGAFPNLQTLYIGGCWSLEEIVPDGLRSITSLNEIDMRHMPIKFIDRYGSLPSIHR